jgi:predicted esterase
MATTRRTLTTTTSETTTRSFSPCPAYWLKLTWCCILIVSLASTRQVVQAMSSPPTTPSTTTSRSTSSTTPNQKPLIVFCHGSGDTGPGVQAWIESLVPSHSVFQEWDWIFPSATPIPYSLNHGSNTLSSVWYDRIGGFDPSFPEHTASIEQSTHQLLELLEDQVNRHGRDPRRIILGGFSMGGAIALQTAVR